MKRNGTVLTVIVALVALMIYAGARLSRNRGGGGGEETSALKGNMAPDFELKVLGNAHVQHPGHGPAEGVAANHVDSGRATSPVEALDGKTVKLSSYRGKAVLLNFWATWCGPCKVEMPWFVDFYKKYQPQGLEIVGVAMDDSSSRDEIPRFIKEMNVNYTILEGTEKVGDAYGGVDGLPTTFFIDRNGRIVNVVFGLKDQSDLEEDIKKALSVPLQSASATTASAKNSAAR